MAPLKNLIAAFLLPAAVLGAKEFTVVACNVENLFDVDGVAIYDDYLQDGPEDPFAYSRAKLLTKLENTAAVLAAINDGAGPEVILFQELEGDFTPESSVDYLDAFLETHRDKTVADMLGEQWNADYAGLPAVAWLAKALEDHGMDGYEVAVGDARPPEDGIAHVNALFSRFPITQVGSHPVEMARDILEARIDVDGHPVWLYVNHWKSGASDPKREPIRVNNAKVLRAFLDGRLANDPAADIIVGGDLNSHYNHDLIFPELETGINHVLGSQGDENFGDADLYNLWFELPVGERYSEVWRGNKGTLMHLLVTPGLYDDSGVSYVDGSFDKLTVPGLNIDALGRPLDWSFAGTEGGGVSDHFPVLARFGTDAFEAAAELSDGKDAPDEELPLEIDPALAADLEDGAFLAGISDAGLGPYIGKIYRVRATVQSLRPLELKVEETHWNAYAPAPQTLLALKQARKTDPAQPLDLIVSFGVWKGERQLVVEKVRPPFE